MKQQSYINTSQTTSGKNAWPPATWLLPLVLGFTLAWIIFLFVSLVASGQSTLTGTVTAGANLRAGPGTSYAIVAKVAQGQKVTIARHNDADDWYQLTDGL